jgi:hypothetical protein
MQKRDGVDQRGENEDQGRPTSKQPVQPSPPEDRGGSGR